MKIIKIKSDEVIVERSAPVRKLSKSQLLELVNGKKPRCVQSLFKPYFVNRKNGQCQVLIPLIELDELCEKIEQYYTKNDICKRP